MEDCLIHTDPGCTKYGNFINYYEFNTFKSRIELIPQNILETLNDLKENIFILDIGCNSGDLTLGLYDHLIKPASIISINILAIDIDGNLIERCKDKSQNYEEVLFKKADVMLDLDRQTVIDKYLREKNITKFDLIFVFSLTMWIHMNNGDEGLENFLIYISSICHYIMIEPQPWICYKNAERRTRRTQKSFIKKINAQMSTDLKSDSNIYNSKCNSNFIDFNISNNSQTENHKSIDIDSNKLYNVFNSPLVNLNNIQSSYLEHLESFNINVSKLRWRNKIDEIIIELLTKNCMQIVKKFGKTKWSRELTLLKNTNIF